MKVDTTQTTIRLEPQLLEQLRRKADERGYLLTHFVVLSIFHHFQQGH